MFTLTSFSSLLLGSDNFHLSNEAIKSIESRRGPSPAVDKGVNKLHTVGEQLVSFIVECNDLADKLGTL